MLAEASERPLYLVLLGGPGAGKGTQGQWLSSYLALPRISSGDLFREHIQSRTELGRQAKVYLEQGLLVPDTLTLSLIMERLAQTDGRHGAILDGFPRTLAQAQALDWALAAEYKCVKAAINLRVDPQTLAARLSGRWLCRVCGAAYHTQFCPPATPGRCDHCGNALSQRDDDKPATVAHRIDVYLRQSAPLVAYYRQRGILLEVDGAQPVECVHQVILQTLRRFGV